MFIKRKNIIINVLSIEKTKGENKIIMKRKFTTFLSKSLFCGIMFTLAMQAPSMAQNVLSEIKISPDGNSYQVLLKTEKPVPIKKVIETNNKIYIELQNVEPLASVSTIYNNVPNINNVVVEPMSKNSVKILVQGKNVNDAKVQFESTNILKNNTPKATSEKTIELSPPIESFNNIYDQGDEEENLVLTSSVKATILAGLKHAKGMIGSHMMYFMGFILILAFGFRLFRKKETTMPDKKPAASIGLTRSLQQNESSQIKDVLVSKRKGSLVDTSVGLRRYQDAERSPYATPYRTPARRSRTPLTVPKTKNEIKTTPLADLKSKVMTATLNSHATDSTKTVGKTGGVDSIKFIESMTKIYEKNGRSDLAEGLKNSLKKAQQKVR